MLKSTRRHRFLILATALSVNGFAMPALAGYVFNTLTIFNTTDGSNPVAAPVILGQTIYGTTENGGANNSGTVFSIPLAGGVPTTLATFNGSNGANPSAGLTLASNTLYGTTVRGGANGIAGTVFWLPVAGGALTSVAFNGSNGSFPTGTLTLSGNTLYGTTEYGGIGNGSIFLFPVGGGSIKTVVAFDGTEGYEPEAGVTVSNGVFYGTMYGGGQYGFGTVFSVPIAGGTPTTLAFFNRSNGENPQSGLIRSGDNLYGMTAYGGDNNGDGTLFSLPVTGGPLTTVVAFNGSNGSSFKSNLILSGNTLYGTTYQGGKYGYGTVFSLPINGGVPTVLVNFNKSDGANPVAAGMTLVGNMLYGMTNGGGSNGAGTVFSVSTIPNPIISVTAGIPTGFGSQVGMLTLGNRGKYDIGSITFPSTPTGYLAASAFNPPSATEIYALKIDDSDAASLSIDLADAVNEINTATYNGYSVNASSIDPTGILGSGYNLYITINDPTLGTNLTDFGFDFTQLNDTPHILSVTAAAAATPVPEPASLALLTTGGFTLLRRSRMKGGSSKGDTHLRADSQYPLQCHRGRVALAT